jgi:hypothetical protein
MTQIKIFPYFNIWWLLVTTLYAGEIKIGDIPDGSLAVPVHLIKLIDEDSSVIRLNENPLLPFSLEKTCGACHNYQKISSGWHFNAVDSTVAAGRPGQPWIYSDAHSGTQMALSYRDWPQAFHPSQIGMTAMDFVTRYGRQMPGGSIGENENLRSLDNYFRWQVSGKLEVNCLTCHDLEKSHNRAEYAVHTARQNFRWAATASSAFAAVNGTVKDLPDFYTVYDIIDPDQSQTTAPYVIYEEERFNEKSEVFFDIERKIPSANCYFCHSSKLIGDEITERWHLDEDVHISAGMECVDCHRNGLDHNMNRGYEKTSAGHNSLTCEGCHIPQTGNSIKPVNGRFGAPVPEHKGIPVIHFEEMACTACHSGAWPEETNIMLKTSMAHGLGLHTVNRSDSTLPHIQTPVFTAGHDGKIAPHNVLWQSWWGVKNEEKIDPLQMDIFLPVARMIIGHIDSLGNNTWPVLDDSVIVQVLDSLQKSNLPEGKAVYVSAGKVFYIGPDGLISDDHEAAKPYLWQFAHNVRPAAQSLGINGCADCHNPFANFSFAAVSPNTPLKRMSASGIKMTSFLDQNFVYEKIFSSSFYFRTIVKYTIFICAFLILSVLLIYFLKGLTVSLAYFSSAIKKRDN